MGGSGGGGRYYSSSTFNATEFAKSIRDAEETAKKTAYETSISSWLSELLVAFNDRDVDGVRQVLDTVLADLKEETKDVLKLVFGGSVAKKTYVEGISDVDALIVLKHPRGDKHLPSELKQQLADLLIGRYGAQNVSVGQVAVTLTRGDASIQLLPCVEDSKGLHVPAWKGDSWTPTNAKKFGEQLSKSNEACDYKLVPVIKLIKAINAELVPENVRLSGYHCEALALKAFERYPGKRTSKDMISHFFEKAPSLVSSPIPDVSGQSTYVDEYLGKKDSLERKTAANALRAVHRRLKLADESQNLDIWKGLFPQ